MIKILLLLASACFAVYTPVFVVDTLKNVTDTVNVSIIPTDTISITTTDTIYTRNVDTVYVLQADTVLVKIADTSNVRIAVRIYDTVRVFLTDPSSRIAQMDGSTWAQNVMSYEHHEIHSGSHYFVCGYGTFGAADDIDFQIVTPDSSREAHMTFVIQSTGETVFTIYESADFDLDGTPVTAYNNDRNSANTTILTLQSDGTVNTAGTPIYSQAFGFADTPSKIAGGAVSRDKEIILDQNNQYRFFIESNSADNIISYCGEYYEHTSKE